MDIRYFHDISHMKHYHTFPLIQYFSCPVEMLGMGCHDRQDLSVVNARESLVSCKNNPFKLTKDIVAVLIMRSLWSLYFFSESADVNSMKHIGWELWRLNTHASHES